MAWAAEIVGRVVGRSQSGASEERTACERRKRRNCSKALVQCTELVMFVTIERPKDKGEIQCWKVPTRYQVDGSDEVVTHGTTDRVVKARVGCRMPEEQRSDARDTKSVRGVPLQQTSAETAEGGLVNAACVVSVRLTRTVVERREDKARWFRGRREVELAKCGFSVGCEGCRVAASGDEVLRRGKECR